MVTVARGFGPPRAVALGGPDNVVTIARRCGPPRAGWRVGDRRGASRRSAAGAERGAAARADHARVDRLDVEERAALTARPVRRRVQRRARARVRAGAALHSPSSSWFALVIERPSDRAPTGSPRPRDLRDCLGSAAQLLRRMRCRHRDPQPRRALGHGLRTDCPARRRAAPAAARRASSSWSASRPRSDDVARTRRAARSPPRAAHHAARGSSPADARTRAGPVSRSSRAASAPPTIGGAGAVEKMKRTRGVHEVPRHVGRAATNAP